MDDGEWAGPQVSSPAQQLKRRGGSSIQETFPSLSHYEPSLNSYSQSGFYSHSEIGVAVDVLCFDPLLRPLHVPSFNSAIFQRGGWTCLESFPF